MSKKSSLDPKNLIFGHKQLIQNMSIQDRIRLAKKADTKTIKEILLSLKSDKKNYQKCLLLAKKRGINNIG